MSRGSGAEHITTPSAAHSLSLPPDGPWLFVSSCDHGLALLAVHQSRLDRRTQGVQDRGGPGNSLTEKARADNKAGYSIALSGRIVI